MARLYGIPNCGTVKKARAWLDGQSVSYVFHDFKKQGLDETELRAWIAALGWETLLNRRGTTWRKLPESVRDGIDEQRAVELMLESPSVIRRPVLEQGGRYLIGFAEAEYQEIFG